MKYKLTIGWLYPTLMNVYGDRGNIIALQKRCEWRNIDTNVELLELNFSKEQLNKCDILLMGGAQDRQQKIVNDDLKNKHAELSRIISSGTPGLYVCGGYQFLGKYYKEADGTIIDGLGIFDIYTESPSNEAPRLIGNMGFNADLDGESSVIIGFENHGGRTYLGKRISPFGTIVKGFGNNEKDKTEGARFMNSFGTYCHGPILPKNPDFADFLIKKALEKKYDGKVTLKDLNNAIESRARFAIANRMGIRI